MASWFLRKIYARKLHLTSSQSFVAQSLVFWTLVDVSLEEGSSVVSFLCHLVFVMIPVELVDVDPEVLSWFYYLKDVSIDGMWMIYKRSLVAYLENLAFMGTEFMSQSFFHSWRASRSSWRRTASLDVLMRIKDARMQSSAKSRTEKLFFLYSRRSLIYNRKRTLPRGTPDRTGAESDFQFSRISVCVRSRRKSPIQLCRLPWIP